MIEYNHLGDGADFQTPNLIVVHAMAEYIKFDKRVVHAVDYLDEIGLSAHSFIAPNGTIFRCREDDQGAYHALGHNKNSLGIEFLVKGEHDYASFIDTIQNKDYLSDCQYKIGLDQILEWFEMHDINKLTRHSDLSPDRKIDPGKGFPWGKFVSDIRFSTRGVIK